MAAPERSRHLTGADVLDIAARMNEAASVEELRDLLHGALTPFGFIGFTFAAVRRVKSVHLHAEITATWRRTTQTTFQQGHLFNADPVIIRSRTATEPFVWSLSAYERGNPQHEEIAALRRALGVTGGICVPVPEAWHGRCVLYLSGAGFDDSQQALLALQVLAAHFAGRVHTLNSLDGPRDRNAARNLEIGELSARERQVFGWLAFGKTSWDVSVIMAISEHTVNEYISSGVAKLKASNRTEAVMRALLTNQIDLS
jgi:DNA-binding CsgD family transcriptional regulator